MYFNNRLFTRNSIDKKPETFNHQISARFLIGLLFLFCVASEVMPYMAFCISFAETTVQFKVICYIVLLLYIITL